MLVVRLEGEWGVNEVRRQLESQDNRNKYPSEGLAPSTRTLALEECQYLCTAKVGIQIFRGETGSFLHLRNPYIRK